MPRKRVSDVALRRTFRSAIVMPVFPPKADIRQGEWNFAKAKSGEILFDLPQCAPCLRVRFHLLAIRRIFEQWICVLLHAFLSYRLRQLT
jgi:hypothetical protein